jgi:hypothetical protein
MMKVPISKPINDVQERFNELCELGGGVRGGPADTKVRELLRWAGKRLNGLAYREAAEQFDAYPEANPWHVCFAVGLSWGHLAQLHVDFTGAVVGLLRAWNSADLRAARSFALERGPDPIEQSLIGAYTLFDRVTLPKTLPDTLARLGKAQERWLSPVLTGSDRPKYIGSWNSTAMFMAALFAQPALASTQIEQPPILPPGGPIFKGLQLLHQVGILSRPPSGTELDDESFEPGALYENNQLLADLRKGLSAWSLIDVHSGVYMLGTRHPLSGTWS